MMNDASTTFRLTYDWSKQQVRVTWYMVLALKGRQRPFHVDGISVYHINDQGKANRHELETVIVNGVPVEPPFAYAWINLPAWVAHPGMARKPVALPFPNGIAAPYNPKALLAGFERDVDMGYFVNAFESNPDLQQDFMKALTSLDASAELSEAAGTETPKEEEKAEPEPAKEVRKIKQRHSLFGGRAPLECDTSFDCTGGLVCCDFLLVKVCCSNGIRQPKYGDLIPALVPIPGRTNDNEPRGGGW